MVLSRRRFLASVATGMGTLTCASLSWPARSRVSLLELGCKGDGSSDDSDAFRKAVAHDLPLTGEGRWYGIAGNAHFSSAIDLEDAGLVALSPGPKTRVLHKSGPMPARLARVKINRNGTQGTIGDSAGAWLAGAIGVEIEDCEAFGGGAGTGFFFVGCGGVRHRRTFVHSMRWRAETDPGSGGERIQGVRHQDCWDIEVHDPRLVDLLGQFGSSDPWAYQSDGLVFGNCSNFKVIGGFATNVGEAIDCSGRGANRDFLIDGFETYRAGAFGIKILSSAHNGVVRNTKHREPGIAGCVVGGSYRGIPESNITFERNQVISPGKNRNRYWSKMIPAAYWVVPGGGPPAENIAFIDCDGIDDSRSMKYLIRNEASMPVRRIGGKSIGHTVAETVGPVTSF